MTAPSTEEARFRLGCLAKAKPCFRPSRARQYLEARLFRYQILDLYQWKMPAQFNQHPHSDRYKSCVRGVHIEETHTLLETGFLEHLDELMPYVPWGDEWHGEELAERMLIEDMGINIYADGALEMLPDSFLIFVGLTLVGQDLLHSYGKDELRTEFGRPLGLLIWRACQFKPTTSFKQEAAIRRRFNQEPAPLRFVPMAVRSIEKDTGNYWLDAVSNPETDPVYYTYMAWSRAEFTKAERHGNQALDYLSKVNDLITWVEADVPTRGKQILEIWNQSLT